MEIGLAFVAGSLFGATLFLLSIRMIPSLPSEVTVNKAVKKRKSNFDPRAPFAGLMQNRPEDESYAEDPIDNRQDRRKERQGIPINDI